MILLRIRIPRECPDCGRSLEHHDGHGNTCPCQAVMCRHCENHWHDTQFEVDNNDEYVNKKIRHRFEGDTQ
ncbi:hypothetical protein GCM10028856_04920 [Halopiger thermotolerans]